MCYLLGIQLVFVGFAGAVLFGKATKDSTCVTCSKGYAYLNGRKYRRDKYAKCSNLADDQGSSRWFGDPAR